MPRKQPEKCEVETCGRIDNRLYYDHDLKKWVCNKCWKETHNIQQIKMNWAAIGVAH